MKEARIKKPQGILYGSTYTTLWKMQNYGDRKHSRFWRLADYKGTRVILRMVEYHSTFFIVLVVVTKLLAFIKAHINCVLKR